MFSKAKKKQADGDNIQQSAPAEDQTIRQSSSSQNSSAKSSAKRSSSMKNPGVPSLISTDVVLEGNLVSSGEVQFDGNITGNIRAASLIIGEKATVKGEVACEAVTVRGRVEGMVRARNVALASTAYIEGDIMHSSLSVEPGAHFDGNCRHSEDPLADDAARAFDRPSGNRGGAPAPRPVPSSPSTTSSETNAMNTVPSLDEAMPANGAHATASFQGQEAPTRSNGHFAPRNNTAQQSANASQGASSFMVKNRSPLR